MVNGKHCYAALLPRRGRILRRTLSVCLKELDNAVMNINEAALVSPRVFNFIELWDR